MANKATALTGAAGEHYVAFRLSALGFPVALTRGGSPTVDLMVGDLSGENVISIQVKTSTGANRERKRNPSSSHWEWDVGAKAMKLVGKSIFYAFVDLKWKGGEESPDVFIVPSQAVADFVKPEHTRYMFWIPLGDKNAYLNRWDLITNRLEATGH